MTHPVTIQNNNLTRDKKIPGWVFDEGKTHLTITQLNEKISLSKLPPSLEKLTLVDNDGLESIDLEGCSNLEELTVQECSNFSEIKNLDQCTRLRSLTLSRAWHLKNNERPLNLPPSLEILIVHSSDGLSLNKENIPDLLLLETCHENLREISEIPKSLEALHLWHCEGSIGLNSYDFPNLKTLELHGNLTAVTALPKSLRTLHVFNPNLKLLNLTNCRELIYVDLENCQSLNPDPILLMQLDEIENDHRSRVVLPRHWPSKDVVIAEAKENLDEAIAEHSSVMPFLDSCKIRQLLHEFTSQNLKQRNVFEIIEAVKPLIEVIDHDPSSVIWMEYLVSNGFFKECVNQRVQGWMELCGYAAVCLATSEEEKLEASKQILVQTWLTQFIDERVDPKYGSRVVGSGLEAEFGNASMRKIDAVLSQNSTIKKPWLGIPGRIANEGLIKERLTPEFITDACAYLQEKVLSKTSNEIFEMMLSHHQAPQWIRAFAFENEKMTEGLKGIDKKYEEEEKEFLRFMDGALGSGLSEALESVNDPRKKEYFETEFTKRTQGKTPAERSTLVQDGFAAIDTSKHQDQVAMVRAVTGRKIIEQEVDLRPDPTLEPTTSIAGTVASSADDVKSRQGSIVEVQPERQAQPGAAPQIHPDIISRRRVKEPDSGRFSTA